jgi:uncharacterized protein CbrC (UPF0167 family)
MSRGYIYTASVYAEADLNESICPWCIADGSAAEKFTAAFADSQPLGEAGIPDEVIEQVTKRTPGYTSWQQEHWMCCCNDACEFHGDAPKMELRSLVGEARDSLLSDLGLDEEDWESFVDNYEPGGDPAVYKFICRHCEKSVYNADFS